MALNIRNSPENVSFFYGIIKNATVRIGPIILVKPVLMNVCSYCINYNTHVEVCLLLKLGQLFTRVADCRKLY